MTTTTAPQRTALTPPVGRKRLLTGDRPTGRLHLGHYVGSLANRVRLQHEYDACFIVADLHTLTTKPEPQSIKAIPGFIREIALDYLAIGIDPEVSTIFVQSAIPETYELNLIFEMLVTVPRLERLPSLKDMARDAHLDTMPLGLLGYPVLQAVDILLPRADIVPVGRDNQAHVEITREIARRFNHLYGREPDFEEKAERAIKELGGRNITLYRNLRKRFQEAGDVAALERARALVEGNARITVADRERLLGCPRTNRPARSTHRPRRDSP